MLELTQATLGDITSVPTPRYDRSALRTGIVHFGLGNFHRAHQAAYLDDLMSQGKAQDWAICGVGVMPADARMRDVLLAQDNLYTLTLKNSDGTLEPRIIGSIHRYLFAPDDPEAVIDAMTAATTRIVSLTVTEGGYNINDLSGEFDADSPDVHHDVTTGEAPRTVFGLVVEALKRRRSAGTPPFTIMSCDNIQGNGTTAKRAFVSFARLIDSELSDWIDSEVAFPNSMVDRITPVTTDTDRDFVRNEFGIVDGWPVFCEPFTQWVLEEHFPLGRPPYEDVGVQLVQNVEPYELMKLRLLNGSHQALAYFGYLNGYRLVHEAVADPVMAEMLRRYMDEVTPTLHPVPGIDLNQYKDMLIQRFSNPEIRDTLARLGAESSDRIPKFVLPAIRDNLRRHRSVTFGAAVIASWARYMEGTDETGNPIEIADRFKDSLRSAAQNQRQDPRAFLSNRQIFGDLVSDAHFLRAYFEATELIRSLGVHQALRHLLGWVKPDDLSETKEQGR